MNRRRFVFPVIAILGVIVVGTIFNLNPPFPILWRRVRIPETNLSIQIPAGYEYLGGSSLFIVDDLDSIETTPAYPVFRVWATKFTNSYREYQAPQDVLMMVFHDDFEHPQRQIINGVEVYLARLIGEPPEVETQVVRALLIHKNQYISFDAVGLPSETETIYAMVEVMLDSLLVEENK
jgi:hypothetical protein